jgi:hypothetical protein
MFFVNNRLNNLKKQLATDTHGQIQTSCCATCTTTDFSPPATVFKNNLPEADSYPLICQSSVVSYTDNSISGYVF